MEIENYPINVPYYDLSGYHVWGATAMIIAEFISVVRTAGTFSQQ